MFILIEFDYHWAGIGIEKYTIIYGIRLGFMAIHLVRAPFSACFKPRCD
jgi:hypothetical protein